MATERGSLINTLSVLQGLDSTQATVYLDVLRHSSSTPSEITDRLGIDQTGVADSLNALASLGLIRSISSLGRIRWTTASSPPRAPVTGKLRGGAIIPLVYHYNLLSDRKRLGAFARAIRRTVRPGQIVGDLGCGSGILSILAAQRGAFVYAVEADPNVAEAAEIAIRDSGLRDRVSVIIGDVREISLPAPLDVCICEMLDTGLIAELQVPAMNVAVERLIKPGGTVIPLAAESFIEAGEADYSFYGTEFRLPHFEEYGARRLHRVLSTRKSYHRAVFDRLNPVSVKTDIMLRILADGRINAIRVSTEVEMLAGLLVSASKWLNPPLILPVPDLVVSHGQGLVVSLEYELGGKIEDVRVAARLATQRKG